jgi:hypothetical protein
MPGPEQNPFVATPRETHKKETWETEALQRVAEVLRFPGSPYLEGLYWISGEWAHKFEAVEAQVPPELQKDADTFYIEMAIGQGDVVRPELLKYKQEVDKIKAAFAEFIRSQTPEAVLAKALDQYRADLVRNPKYAKHIAYSFLSEAHVARASQSWVAQSIETFERAESVPEKMKAAKVILEGPVFSGALTESG